MLSKRALLALAVVAAATLTGSRCVFIATSGDHACRSSTDRHCESRKTAGAGATVAIDDGRLIDAPVEGVSYASGSVTGVTNAQGGFRYEAGNRVRFFIGDIVLGEAVEGKAVITPLDLVPDGTIDTPAVINIARLLQSLDSLPGDDRITIPARLRTDAVRSSEAAGASIASLDFADETAFVNAAAQLVSTLTAPYPFTAVLVDRRTAQVHLLQSLGNSGTLKPLSLK